MSDGSAQIRILAVDDHRVVRRNEEGRAYEMWKHMIQECEEFIASSLLRQ